MARFQKGQSGNPNGRPLKNRALTELLEAAGNATIQDKDGKRRAKKRVVASLAWELLTEGKATLPNNETLKVSPQDWIGLYKWIYTHIDGPPKAELDVTSGGKEIGTGKDEIRNEILRKLDSIASATDAESIPDKSDKR